MPQDHKVLTLHLGPTGTRERYQVKADFADEATQGVIRKTLLAREYHLVHYTGHGGFDPTAKGVSGR